MASHIPDELLSAIAICWSDANGRVLELDPEHVRESASLFLQQEIDPRTYNIAAEQLRSEGYNVPLFQFETKKSGRKVKEVVKNRHSHDREEVFDDGDQVFNESLTTGAIAATMAPLNKGKSMAGAKMKQPGNAIGGKKMKHEDTGKTSTEMTEHGEPFGKKQKNTGGQSKFEGHRDGDMSEGQELTPDTIAATIVDDGAPMQELFDIYARGSVNYVSLREFNEIARAYGCTCQDERTFVHLLESNHEFVFVEGSDAQGRYWVPQPIVEGSMPPQFKDQAGKKDDDSDDHDDHDIGGEGKKKKKKKEWKKPWLKDDAAEESVNSDGTPLLEMFGGGMAAGGMAAGGMAAAVEPPITGGPMACPHCNHPGMDEAGCQMCGYCPQDADRMGDPGMDDMGGHDMGSMGDVGNMGGVDDMGDMGGDPGMGGVDDMGGGHGEFGPEFEFGGGRPQPAPRHHQHAPRFEDANDDLSDEVNAIMENDKVGMDGPDGDGVVERSGNGKKSGLPSEKTDTTEMGKEWPRKLKNTGGQAEFGNSKHAEASDGIQKHHGSIDLGGKQKNTGGQWEEFGGSPGKMTGGAAKMHESVSFLAKHVKRTLAEYARDKQIASNNGKYPLRFVVSAGESVKPKLHNQLTEALVDAEELIQIFGPDKVSFEAQFCNSEGQTIMKRLVPMVRVAQRGPIVSEGRILFRFPELAMGMADKIIDEGKVCRATTHNWGAAVTAKMTYGDATRLFATLGEAHDPSSPNCQCLSPDTKDSPGKCMQCGKPVAKHDK